MNCRPAATEKGLVDMSVLPHRLSTTVCPGVRSGLTTRAGTVQFALQIINRAAERIVALDFLSDLRFGVEHGAMVPSAEVSADFTQAVVGQLPWQQNQQWLSQLH